MECRCGVERDHRPSDPDLKALDEYLISDDSPENCMQLSDLDGFLTAIVVGPETHPAECAGRDPVEPFPGADRSGIAKPFADGVKEAALFTNA